MFMDSQTICGLKKSTTTAVVSLSVRGSRYFTVQLREQSVDLSSLFSVAAYIVHLLFASTATDVTLPRLSWTGWNHESPAS